MTIELKSYTTAASAKKAATKAAEKASDDFYLIGVESFKTDNFGKISYHGRLTVDQMRISAEDSEAVEGFEVRDPTGAYVMVENIGVRPDPETPDTEQPEEEETPDVETPNTTGETEQDQPETDEEETEEVDPKAAVKAQIKASRYEWFAKHGLINEEQAAAAKAKAELPTIGRISKEARYTYLGLTGDGSGNHRNKVGGDGYNMIEWLKANPGSTRAEMAKAGFPAVHIRWDLVRTPQLFQVEFPQGSDTDDDQPADEVEVAEQAETEQTIEAEETAEISQPELTTVEEETTN